MKQKPTKITSIEKTLAILLTFAPHNHEMGTVEISQKLGFHKATVSRILLTLMKSAFLEQNPQTRKFRLGASILSLGSAARHSLKTNMVQIAKPHIDELRDRLRETIVLEALSGKNTFMAYIAEGPRRVRIAGTLGDRLPIYAAAGAKAILAFSLPEVVENLLDQEMPRLTPNTITDPRIFKRQLKLIRHQGFSYDNEEIDIGISAVGAPIFNHEDKPVAALVVAGPSQRVTWGSGSAIVPLLKDTAAKISAQLYYEQ